ncbi:hypothetical protein PC121_g21919 [Phytophthora cactorum]|nr:hypothetical protein PC121_g21919 [Phytophthora cactorum]
MQSFLGALNYYSRFIQDFAVYGAALYQLKEEDFGPGGDLSVAQRAFEALQTKVAEAPIMKHFDRTKEVHVMLFANEWALSTTLMQEHEGKLHPVRFVGRVLKESEVNYHPAEKEVLALLLLLKTCYMQLAGKTLHVYTRFLTLEWVHKSKSLFGRAIQFAVLLSPWHLKVQRVKKQDVVFAQLLQSSITNFVDLEESLAPLAPPNKGSTTIRMDPAMLYARLPRDYRGFVVSFDGSAKTEKYGGYGSCSWVLWSLPEWKIVIAANAYLPSTTANVAEYTGMNNGIKAAIAYGAEHLVIESLLTLLNIHKELMAQLRSVKYLHVVRKYNAAEDSLATEALESKVSRVVLAETRKSELVTLNRIQEMIYESNEDTAEVVPREAEHHVHVLTGSEFSQQKTFEHFVRDDATIKNEYGNMAVMTRRQAKTKKHVRFADEHAEVVSKAHKQRSEHGEVANESSFDERSSSHPSNTVSPATPDAEDIDPVAVQRERRRRIAAAQDEEKKWLNLKKVLRGQAETLSYKEARDALKYADRFVLSEDGVLHYLGLSRRYDHGWQEETKLRLVVPTTMFQEVLQNCHDSLEGGHQGVVRTFQRVKSDYYWAGLYADVEKHVKSCPDCSSSKSRPQLRGYSPGNVLAERLFQIVSMDFVIPLPKTRRGNTALLLFQCSFTGFVIAKAMSDTSALSVAQVFEECVYRRFGAPFDKTRPRPTVHKRGLPSLHRDDAVKVSSHFELSATGQRSTRTLSEVGDDFRVYAEDPLQHD